ncbi:MAG: hypothetical protein ACRCU1_10640 [Alsobacter sp.]
MNEKTFEHPPHRTTAARPCPGGLRRLDAAQPVQIAVFDDSCCPSLHSTWNGVYVLPEDEEKMREALEAMR